MNRNSSRLFTLMILAAFSTALAGCKTVADTKSTGKATASENSKYPDEPDVTFEQLQGGSVSLASFKGRVVLVNFWATWCDPCRIEIPWLISFQQKYASRGFTLVGVAMDESGQKVVQPFVETTQFDVDGQKMNMNYPIVIGNEDIAEKFGGLLGYPSSYLISRDGKIVKRIIGLVSEDELAREIELQLAAPAPTASTSATTATP
ncbi:MAG TPA: TlpA disulfide reductase family protein [Candidatus Acidoferrales bacterium]|nr:TlpA disulfide reductase family protein [Candidatus Acidoferrales bacterium]